MPQRGARKLRGDEAIHEDVDGEEEEIVEASYPFQHAHSPPCIVDLASEDTAVLAPGQLDDNLGL